MMCVNYLNLNPINELRLYLLLVTTLCIIDWIGGSRDKKEKIVFAYQIIKTTIFVCFVIFFFYLNITVAMTTNSSF
jgi:hypothetical protein